MQVERAVFYERASYGETHFMSFKAIPLKAIVEIKILDKAELRARNGEIGSVGEKKYYLSFQTVRMQDLLSQEN